LVVSSGYFAIAGVHIYSNTIDGDQYFTAANVHQGGNDADTDTGADPEDGARGGLEVGRVEVAEVAQGQRCGHDDQQRGQDPVEGRLTTWPREAQ
jgi:hypothetical protein